ncbi:MAG: hypothetical protein H6703_10085 [Myxococcales bacterium]|nr:hypothetical protein [Myxococcales bacterium]
MPARPARLRLALVCVTLALALAACHEDRETLSYIDAAAADALPPDGAGDAIADMASDAITDMTPDAITPADLGPDAAVVSPVLRPRFDPAGRGFFSTPWPSDARLTARGTPRLSDFPLGGPTLLRAVAEIEGRVTGFATMPVIYVAFDDDITGAAVPTPIASLDPASPVQLVRLGEGCAERVPVEVSVRAADDIDRFTEAGLLQVKNTVGAVLDPRVPYAMIVTTAFGAPLAKPIAAPPAFVDALAGDGTAWGDALQPLRDCLPALGLAADEIAIATVFTPQDPVGTLQALRARVMDPAQIETRAPLALARDVAWSRRRLRLTTWSGEVEFPVFQAGVTPYNGVGGGFVLDDDGVPVVQRWEAVPVAVAWRELDMPPDPRPALVFIDGTGWSPWTHLHSGWLGNALDAGFVVFSFMPQFHGERAGVTGGPEVPTFNFFNPAAARTNFQQQAAETSYFLRVIREQLTAVEGLPPFDPDDIVYGGHSQGALAGALTAAVESEYAAYVFNGLASYLTLTILERKDLLDFELVVRGLLGADKPLDLFHPALQLLQLGSESVDPHNYARLWRGTPARPEGNHVFVVNGWTDDTTTPRGMDQLTLSAELPTFGPPGWQIDPFGVGVPPVATMPAAGNATSLAGDPLTIATWLDPMEGHGTIYRNAELRRMSIVFWQTARRGVPVLAPNREMACGDGSDDEGDGFIDCDDPDCAGGWPCREVFCADERDDDGDGLVDCADDECGDSPLCQEEDCGDGLDDDGDGLIDCADPGCAGRKPCGESICTDFQDDDGDGLVDCADPECAPRRECREFDCRDLRDNDRDGLLDCADPECLGFLGCPEPSCEDGTDEDGNGFVDCEDPRCAGRPSCPIAAELVCDDGLDDDGDGLADCADPDCALVEACRPAGICADGDLGSALGIAVWQGTLEGRPDDWAPGDCTALGSGKDAPDLALRWTAPADGVYLISTLGSGADTALTLYPDDCDRAREFGCNDDQPGVRTSAIALDIDAGQSVVIVIAAFEEDTVGPVRLHIQPRPGQ